ncbi:MAG: aldo/keto reductase [Candidatus Hodarchaeales archaeon]|jgi:aryl-alcohol dehydrogenase-like predicted oxidoreductase
MSRKLHLGPEVTVNSPIGIGCRLWGTLTVEKAVSLMEEARRIGISLYDTADIYGQGQSEAVLGGAAAHLDRHKIVIATKGGMRRTETGQVVQDSSPKHLQQAVTQSLKRLQSDYIDLYQIHYPDPVVHPRKTAQSLAEYVETGAIKAIGLSNLDRKTLRAWLDQEHVVIAALQVPWNLLQTHALPILNEAKAADIRIFGYTPLLAGLLTPNDATHLRSELPASAMEAAMDYREIIRKWASQHNLSMPEVALGWALQSTQTDITLLGARKVSHLKLCQKAANLASEQSFLAQVKELEELLPSGIPGSVIVQKVTALESGWDGTSLATLELGINLPVPENVLVGTDVEIDVFTGRFVQVKSSE